MEQENSWVLFIGSPWLLCVQDPIFYFPSALALAILSSSHLVLSAVLAFAKRLRNFGWQHRSQKETEEIANQNKTSIMQLPGDAGSLCSALSLCRDVTSLERTQRRIIQTPSLETPETEIIFYLCKWKFLTGIETYPRPLGMYELAQAQARDVLSCLIWVFKMLIWKVWMAVVARVLTGPWRWGMIPRLRFHLVYNPWHNVHRFPEFIFRPSVPRVLQCLTLCLLGESSKSWLQPIHQKKIIKLK